VNLEKNDWDDQLQDVAYSINTQKQKTTKYTPFFLMFNRMPNRIEEVKFIREQSFSTIIFKIIYSLFNMLSQIFLGRE